MRDFRPVVRQWMLLAPLVFSVCSLADSDNASGGGPRWACWYSPTQLSIECLLIQVPTAGLRERAAKIAAVIDRRLPAQVGKIWGSPEQLAGTQISIPLMSSPFDMEFVGVLAKSVMCGARKDCAVRFDTNSDGLAPVRAAALESGSMKSEIMVEMSARDGGLAQAE